MRLVSCQASNNVQSGVSFAGSPRCKKTYVPKAFGMLVFCALTSHKIYDRLTRHLRLDTTLVLLVVIIALGCLDASAQQKEKVQWIRFEQLEDSLRKAPKKVFIDFYTDWCTYCRKMDKQVYVKPNVVEILNSTYYAVKMDAETRDTIRFDGQVFVNSLATKRRRGIHDLAQLLGQRNGRFTPPTMLVLDKEFNIENRYFEYLTSDRLLKALE